MRIEGEVVHGDAIGRTLGFPTANIHMYDESVPDGVWAARVSLRDGRVVPAVVSVGRRPTFYDKDAARLLEAHLIDFAESLYGEWVVVDLMGFIRKQVRFEAIGDLIDAMNSDLERARSLTVTTVDSGSRGEVADHPRAHVPEWALRRVRSAVTPANAAGGAVRGSGVVDGRSAGTLARQLGMSRGLVKRCLRELEERRETLSLDA